MQVECWEIDRPWFDSQAESMSLPNHVLCREIKIVFKGNKGRHNTRSARREDIRIDSLRSLSYLLTKRRTRKAVKV